MRISDKYRRTLETYLDWESVKTPASGSFQEKTKPRPPIEVSEDGVPAEEAICIWESEGKTSRVLPSQIDLFWRYFLGKSQRDWWSKEIGWWNRNGVYIPEEFLNMLGPIPFIDLFGRGPITRIVRFYYDNTYRTWELRLDTLMKKKEEEWRMSYFERDDRDSALKNAWKMIKIKWIEPALWRTKRKIQRGCKL